MTSEVLAGALGGDDAGLAGADGVDLARPAHIQLYSRGVGTAVQWRLLSGNNRELGRGMNLSPDLDHCLKVLEELRARFADARSFIRRSARGMWSWELELDDEPVATSGHEFARLIRCQQGLARFAEGLLHAPVGTTAVNTMARRWDPRQPPADPRRRAFRPRV